MVGLAGFNKKVIGQGSGEAIFAQQAHGPANKMLRQSIKKNIAKGCVKQWAFSTCKGLVARETIYSIKI